MGGEPLLTSLSMENNSNNSHPCTLLSMDTAGSHPASAESSGGGGVVNGSAVGAGGGDRELFVIPRHESVRRHGPPDINLPLSADPSPPPTSWSLDPFDILDVGLGTQTYESEVALTLPPKSSGNGGSAAVGVGARKCAKRGDSIWGAWFFFDHYFRPALVEKPKGKVTRDASGSISGFDKSDLRLDVFLVQHDMENMYMWVFKERPDSALGKMQLRSFMNGHSKHGEPSFPFSADKGFSRSHRMQRKHYRGLSNPQCLHGIEIVNSPNLSAVPEADMKRWAELTGREINFSIPPEASDFESWRNLPSTDFELDRPQPPSSKTIAHSSHNHKKALNGSGLNLSTPPSSDDGMDLSPKCAKRRKDLFGHCAEEDCVMANNSCSDREQEVEVHTVTGEPSWMHDFTGVAKHASGPVTAAKTIYEDDEGYLIMVSMLFSDPHSVKVSWRNTLTHGIVKISCVSTARMPFVKRHDRMFKLTDPAPEHCPPGEFVREIPLATRIPENAKLEAYYDETGTGLEIMVPKHRVGPEEHEVQVCMRPPHLGDSDLVLS
ncbi:uncharacterized protein LOC100821387 [Brachypodium distachyon]|uniref:SHSP domain-containing protein n=1 Tax=Brachypodium distachyon TaxID=15368 RepID=I1HC24_BRADI|nr:uncharacterized protein LOC100821387 [Brachypodium distachyon]KQK02731.1 hypothetical protein BRADI_2g03340v3 [Brachypodium distachyon]|eukprot:XP_003565341.1 uncharacterized protein LOC100821387 [Brachypodium distachyon]